MASNSGLGGIVAGQTSGKVSAEIVLVKALKVLNSALSRRTPMHFRLQAARAVLSVLHDAGIKPSQRDLAVVFRLADGSERARGARDVPSDSATNTTPAPTVEEEKSK